jgi:hypothetical protein
MNIDEMIIKLQERNRSYRTEYIENGTILEIAYDVAYYDIPCDGWDNDNQEGHNCIVVINTDSQ